MSVCVCVCKHSSDELMKGNLVRFLITGNYTNTSEMAPSKCMSHVGAHHYSNIVLAEIYISNCFSPPLCILKPIATEIAEEIQQWKMQLIDL